jgi:hypothetical protein
VTHIWLPAGIYRAHLYATGLAEHTPQLSLDGRPTVGIESFSRASYHRLVLKHLAFDDRLLAFIGVGANSQSIRNASTIRKSTFDWHLTNDSKSTIELASFHDGQWVLDEAENGKHVASGVRCDLVNTCFVNIAPGDYRIHHTWQPLLRIGFAATLGTALLAISLLLFPAALQRRLARSSTEKKSWKSHP